MKSRIFGRFAAATLALAISAGIAFAQTSPMPIARGGTGASTASAARTNLGLAIGTDVQAYDADLAALAGLTSANNKCFYWTGSAAAATYDCTSFGRSIQNAADASALRTLAGTAIGTDVQAYDSDLAALAANSSNGIWARTGAGTGAPRTITGPAAGLSISNGDGVSGNPTLALANDLAAVEGLSSTGLAVRTATDTWATRTITGTSNEICVTNGNGVSGAPTLGLCSSLTFTGKTITGGTYTGATWDNGAIGATTPSTVKGTDVTATGQVVLSGTISPTALSGDQNDYSPTGLSGASTIRIDGGAADRNITGLSGGTDGRIITIINIGSTNKIVLKNQSASSSTANRFLLPADVELQINTQITLRYDGTSSRWRPFSRALSNTGVTAGTYGDATNVPQLTVDAQGRLTAVSNVAISGAGGSYGDTERRNALLNLIYSSKAYGLYRRVLGAFADGFKDASNGGLDAANSSNYTCGGTGYCQPTSSGSTQTIATNSSTTSFSAGTFVSRNTALTAGDVINAIGVYSASAVTVTVKILKRNSSSSYDVAVSESFSHPGGGWVDHTLASNYTIPGTGTYYAGVYHPATSGDDTASITRTFFSSDVTGTAQAPTLEDTNISIPVRVVKNTGVNNMTLVTVDQTADSSVSNGRVLLEVEPIDSITANTDLTAEVTCDDAVSGYASASLTAIGAGQSGRTVYESSDTSCPASGTVAKARVKTITNKNIKLHGLSLTFH